jgi:hypothetical protein
MATVSALDPDQREMYRLTDWMVREAAAQALEDGTMSQSANQLRDLDPIIDQYSVAEASTTVQRAREEARSNAYRQQPHISLYDTGEHRFPPAVRRIMQLATRAAHIARDVEDPEAARLEVLDIASEVASACLDSGVRLDTQQRMGAELLAGGWRGTVGQLQQSASALRNMDRVTQLHALELADNWQGTPHELVDQLQELAPAHPIEPELPEALVEPGFEPATDAGWTSFERETSDDDGDQVRSFDAGDFAVDGDELTPEEIAELNAGYRRDLTELNAQVDLMVPQHGEEVAFAL